MDIPFDNTGVSIETSRLTIRPFTQADLGDFFEYASVPGVGEMAGWLHHTSVETTRTRLQTYIENKDVFAIHCKANGKVIGSLGLHDSWINEEKGYQQLKTKDISFVLSKVYWGQGLMPEAVQAIIDYGFTIMGLDALSIAHFVSNPQSKRVVEKCGFKFLSTGTYYAKLLDKHFDELRYILVKEK